MSPIAHIGKTIYFNSSVALLLLYLSELVAAPPVCHNNSVIDTCKLAEMLRVRLAISNCRKLHSIVQFLSVPPSYFYLFLDLQT